MKGLAQFTERQEAEHPDDQRTDEEGNIHHHAAGLVEGKAAEHIDEKKEKQDPGNRQGVNTQDFRHDGSVRKETRVSTTNMPL